MVEILLSYFVSLNLTLFLGRKRVFLNLLNSHLSPRQSWTRDRPKSEDVRKGVIMDRQLWCGEVDDRYEMYLKATSK